jgi:hypothetical protein
LTEYKLKGLDPFVSEVVTPSDASPYLKGVANQYPTALLDLDGNERASVYLRNTDLNTLQILLQETKRSDIPPAVRRAAVQAIFKILDRHRREWASNLGQLHEELGAIGRAIEVERVQVQSQPKKWSADDRDR